MAVILPHPWLDKGHLKVHDRIFLRWQARRELENRLFETPEEHTVFLIDRIKESCLTATGDR